MTKALVFILFSIPTCKGDSIHIQYFPPYPWEIHIKMPSGFLKPNPNQLQLCRKCGSIFISRCSLFSNFLFFSTNLFLNLFNHPLLVVNGLVSFISRDLLLDSS